MDDERSQLLLTMGTKDCEEFASKGEILRHEQRIYRVKFSPLPGPLSQIRGQLIEKPTSDELALADANPMSEPDLGRPRSR